MSDEEPLVKEEWLNVSKTTGTVRLSSELASDMLREVYEPAMRRHLTWTAEKIEQFDAVAKGMTVEEYREWQAEETKRILAHNKKLSTRTIRKVRRLRERLSDSVYAFKHGIPSYDDDWDY